MPRLGLFQINPTAWLPSGPDLILATQHDHLYSFVISADASSGAAFGGCHYGASAPISSTCLTGRQYELPTLAARLLECLEKRYLQLRAGQVATLRQTYLQVLYRYREPCPYEVDGQTVTGRIIGVDEAGQLLVEIDGQQRHFGLQQIKYLPIAS